MLFIGLFREKHERIFLSETTKPKALIFGMKNYLVVFYQVCSNYTPGTKMAPSLGHMLYIDLNRETHEKIFLVSKPLGLEP